MSEYQYYEFRAIDRPLDEAAQQALRAISSRARITTTSFVNHYEWGDLNGDPRALMAQWFDIHLYLANWGTRRLMIRVPRRFLDPKDVAPFLQAVEWADVRVSGEHVIIDIRLDDMEPGYDDDDGSVWLPSLAPLRADLLSGDLRLFYLLWLMAVQYGLIADDDLEPMPGISPVTHALERLGAFFEIDSDLIAAAAERGEDSVAHSGDMREILAALPDEERLNLLLRVTEGDPYVAVELKRWLRSPQSSRATRRTVGALQQRAQEIARARENAEAECKAAERRRQVEEAEKARNVRLKALKKRGTAAWRDVETEIERRNPTGYDRATYLLTDLRALASKERRDADFASRLAVIRQRHEGKRKFIERLDQLEVEDDEWR